VEQPVLIAPDTSYVSINASDIDTPARSRSLSPENSNQEEEKKSFKNIDEDA